MVAFIILMYCKIEAVQWIECRGITEWHDIQYNIYYIDCGEWCLTSWGSLRLTQLLITQITDSIIINMASMNTFPQVTVDDESMIKRNQHTITAITISSSLVVVVVFGERPSGDRFEDTAVLEFGEYTTVMKHSVVHVCMIWKYMQYVLWTQLGDLIPTILGMYLFAGLDHWTGLLDWTTGLTSHSHLHMRIV